MQDSHTHVSADDTAGDSSPLRLAGAGRLGCRSGWPAAWMSTWPPSWHTCARGCWLPRPWSAWRSWMS